jgi:hypothetical protein
MSNPDQASADPWQLFALVRWWLTERGHVPDTVMHAYLRSLTHGRT